jgi:hypothetical protein
MTILSILQPLIPLIIFALPSITFFLSFYKSLRSVPERPPASASRIALLRYTFHKAYFQYLVTGPGYVLNPAERSVLDAFILILVVAAVYGGTLLGPAVCKGVRMLWRDDGPNATDWTVSATGPWNCSVREQLYTVYPVVGTMYWTMENSSAWRYDLFLQEWA